MSQVEIITIKKEPNTFENYGAENLHDDEDPGSRCGEIYVGNNARKWTFICTFCDKSVREIDEFINHIKYAHVHLPPPLPADSTTTSSIHFPIGSDVNNSVKPEVHLFNPLDKTLSEFVDYNDFLDVNVQTVPEEILSDNNGRINVSQPLGSQTRIKSEPESEKEDGQVLRYTRSKQPAPPNSPSAAPPNPLSTAPLNPASAAFPQPPPTPASIKPLQPVSPIEPKLDVVTKPRRQRKSRSRRKQIKGPAFCQICKRTFQYHSLYRNHMVKHTSETPFTCTICKKGFKSKQAIRYHMTTHQREKPFKCELCESSFYHEWQFVSHMETHRSENNHPCEVCGKINRTKFDKDIHMRTHTGDRPFACEFCLKRFRLRHHLSNHLKLHFTYRCDFCRKQFSNSVPMKKPYSCPECLTDPIHTPYIFKTITEEEDEEEDSDDESKDVTFHPIFSPRDPVAMKPHSCKICHKTYANKRSLSVHLSTKHKFVKKIT